jgi:hypothetical protein
MSWEDFVRIFGSTEAQQLYSKIGQIVTVLSAVFAFWNSWSAKRALLADKQQRTRNGEVELGITYRIGDSLYRLSKLALHRTNSLFLNRVRENFFRKRPNQEVTACIDGKDENVGLHDMGSPGENKFVALTFGNLYSEIWQQSTLWAAAGVPCRMVRFLHAFRHDTYATADKIDGYQTGRSMLFPLEEVERAGTDPDFLLSGTEISYQKDRLYQMREIYRVWKSKEESDKWRVIELVMPVPEILFLGGEIQQLSSLVSQATQAIEALRSLGGELESSRLDELAQRAASAALQKLATGLNAT